MPVPLRERLRNVFSPAINGSSTGDGSAISPPASVPIEAEARPRPAEATQTEERGRHGDADSTPASELTSLPIAQGHELLGPCRGCTGYWTRELTRGQKPLTCPVCKRLGPPT